MIDLNKKYTLRNGIPVDLHAILDGFVIGSYRHRNARCAITCCAEDGAFYNNKDTSNFDMIEVSPYADFVIDDKVIVWDEYLPQRMHRQHFAGVTEHGRPQTWEYGRTSFSTKDGVKNSWDHCIKYIEDSK
jgi:hypothetical protein